MGAESETAPGGLFWPGLLARQLPLLAFFAGIFACRHFWPGLAALALLLLTLPGRMPAARLPQLAGDKRALLAYRLFLPLALPAAFLCGFGYTALRSPAASPLPDWAAAALDHETRDSPYAKGFLARARVEESSGQPDRRLRLILGGLRPAGDPAGPPLPDRAVLTWQDALSPENPPGAVFAGDSPLPDRVTPLPRRPLPGDELELRLKLRPIRSLSNPGLWEAENYWADRGVRQRAWSKGADPGLKITGGPAAGAGEILRESLRLRVLDALPSEGGRLLPGAEFIPALLFGDRYLLKSADLNLLSKATLSHSLALSGLHLGYAAALGYALARLIYLLFPALALRLPRPRGAALLALFPALAYLWLGSAPPSLLRAFCMLLFCCLLIFLRRPSVILDGLIWAVAVILLLNPAAAFDIRLQLSALSIAAIALSAPVLIRLSAAAETRFRFMRPVWLKLLKGGICMAGISLAAQLALAPLLATTFGQCGLAFPLNLLWLPVLGAWVMPLAFCGLACCALALAGLPLGGLASPLFSLAAAPCAGLLDLLNFLDGSNLLPVLHPPRLGAFFMLGYWTLLACLPMLIMKYKKRARNRAVPARIAKAGRAGLFPLPALLAAGALLCLAPAVPQILERNRDAVTLRLLDAGQGQAVLVEWKGGKRLLVDGSGGFSPRYDIGREIITAALSRGRWPDLDYMLLTHPDLDHLQGLLYPLANIPVRYYADNSPVLDYRENNMDLKPRYAELLGLLAQKGLARASLRAGDVLELAPELRLEVLHPASEDLRGGRFHDNNASLVLRLVWKEHPLALLCGDVETSGQRDLLRRYPARAGALKAQVIVLPHHGSSGASLPAFYKATEPELALASCGYANAWGFPTPKTRKNLEDLGIPLLRTDLAGQISIRWTGGGQGAPEMEVSTSRKQAAAFP